MELRDAPATLVAVGMTADTTVTLRFETALPDMSELSHAIFGAWQSLRDVARHGAGAKLAEAGVFGTGTFRAALWGMPARDREREYASPILRGEVTVYGEVKAAVSPGEDDAPAMVQVTVRLRAPYLAWDTWCGQDVSAALGGPCWVDLYPIQPALPGVDPTRRLRTELAAEVDGGGDTPLLDGIESLATERGEHALASVARQAKSAGKESAVAGALASAMAEGRLSGWSVAAIDGERVATDALANAFDPQDRTGDHASDDEDDAPEGEATASLDDKVRDYLTRVGDNGRALLSALQASGRLTLAEAAVVLKCSPKGAKDAAATCQRWAPVAGLAWPFERVPESTSVIEWQWTGWQAVTA